MLLEGIVTNVAAFGAFVDIGVHQDGLVHVSQLADRFVKDPHEVVKAGDVVKVRVLEVDVAAQAHRPHHAQGRPAATSAPRRRRATRGAGAGATGAQARAAAETGSFGAALLDALKGR